MRENPHVRICGSPGWETTQGHPAIEAGMSMSDRRPFLKAGAVVVRSKKHDDSDWRKGI